MRSNERLHRILAIRKLGGVPAAACPIAEPASTMVSDLRLFALTFAAGFLFTSIFIA
jgi:hypothetical protein